MSVSVLDAVITIAETSGQRVSTVTVEGALVLTIAATLDGDRGSVSIQFAPQSPFVPEPAKGKS